MSITILTSREFDQDISGAMKAAAGGPIFITEGGRPSHVLLTIYDYRRLIDGRMSLAEALAQPHGHFDFDPPRASPGVSGRAWLDQSPA